MAVSGSLFFWQEISHVQQFLWISSYTIWVWRAYLWQNMSNTWPVASRGGLWVCCIIASIMSLPHCVPIVTTAFPCKGAIRH